MDFPEELKYSKEHVWVRMERDTAVIGITDFAQEELGIVSGIELPDEGDEVEQDLDLVGGEHGGGFVHDDHVGLEGQRLADLHHLLLGGAHRLDHRLGVDGHAQVREEVAGPAAHPLLVQ